MFNLNKTACLVNFIRRKKEWKKLLKKILIMWYNIYFTINYKLTLFGMYLKKY